MKVMNRILKMIQKDSNKILFLVVLVSFFNCNSIFAQKAISETSDVELSLHSLNIVSDADVNASTTTLVKPNVNFILWFMGTKEDVNKTFFDDGIYSKKSFLTSGREPNHLLVKTLLKKALNIKSC